LAGRLRRIGGVDPTIEDHLLFEFVRNVFVRIAVIDSRIDVLHRGLILKYRGEDGCGGNP
jgi:hypothetical protein